MSIFGFEENPAICPSIKPKVFQAPVSDEAGGDQSFPSGPAPLRNCQGPYYLPTCQCRKFSWSWVPAYLPGDSSLGGGGLRTCPPPPNPPGLWGQAGKQVVFMGGRLGKWHTMPRSSAPTAHQLPPPSFVPPGLPSWLERGLPRMCHSSAACRTTPISHTGGGQARRHKVGAVSLVGNSACPLFE